MLELKEYTLAELEEILGSNGKQAIDRKLKSWCISYGCDDIRGKGRHYTITAMENPFKVFCITEMGIDSHTDFDKLRDCFYYFLNDVEFREMPDEMKEAEMDKIDRRISRQSIAKYIKHLSKNEFVLLDSGEYNYYFAYKDHRQFTDMKTYREAWALYWETKKRVEYTWEALSEVISKYNGVPRKQPKPEFNVFWVDKINYLNGLVCDEMEKAAHFKLEY